MTVTPSGSTIARSAGTMPRSTSTAVTVAPVVASATVREPSPAPISSTWSPGPTLAIRAMRSTVFGSTTKCWPRAFEGCRPYWRRRRATSPRPGGRRYSTADGAVASIGGVATPLPGLTPSASEPERLLGIHPTDRCQYLGLEPLDSRNGRPDDADVARIVPLTPIRDRREKGRIRLD